MKELYELCAGQIVYGGAATICGYYPQGLIAAIHEDSSKGWTVLDEEDVIVTCVDHEQGYCYVNPQTINK